METLDNLTMGLIILIILFAFINLSIIIGYFRKVNAAWILAVALYLGFFALPLALFGFDFPLSIIMLSGCIGLLAVPLFKNGRLKPLLNDYGIWASMAFVGFAALSMLWTQNIDYGLFKLGAFCVMGVGFGFLTYVVILSYQHFSWWPLLVVGLLYNCAVIVFGEWETYRATFMGQNPIWVTRLALISVTVGLLAVRESKYLRCIVVITGLIVFVVGESRGPLVAFITAWVIGGLIWQLLHNRTALIKRILAGFGALMCIGLIVLLLEQNGLIDMQTRYVTLISNEALAADSNVTTRIDYILRAFNSFLAHPLCGLGIGGYAVGLRSYPHNIFMEIMAELGSIGLILWLVIVYSMWKNAKKDLLFRVLFLQTLFYAFFSGDLAGNIEYVVIGFAAMAWVKADTFVRTVDKPTGSTLIS